MAGSPPYDNIIGIDPLLRDPEHGDYRLEPGSPAEGYGCLSFSGPLRSREPSLPSPPRALALSSIEVSGDLLVDTVWAADTVKVVGDLSVAEGATLNLAPGILVEFQGFYELDVQGRILALGEAEARIRFDAADSQTFAPDSSEQGAWRGIRFRNTPENQEPSLLRFCVIEHAKGIGPGYPGGALSFVGFSNCRIENCILRENAADLGAAVNCSRHAAPELAGCLIEGNFAFEAGAALHCLDAYPRLIACTLVDNHDLNPEIFDRAGVVVAMLSKPRLDGCIVWDNSSSYFLPEHVLQTKPYYTTWNNVELGLAGEGNLNDNPKFTGEGEHPWALDPASPCIDAGPVGELESSLPSVDLAGLPRILDGRVDMGCYEGGGATDAASPAAGVGLALAAHPNPFNPRTDLVFTLTRPEVLDLEILDVRGRRLATVFSGALAEGRHRFEWDGRDADGRPLASGLYLGRLRGSAGSRGVTKLLLLR